MLTTAKRVPAPPSSPPQPPTAGPRVLSLQPSGGSHACALGDGDLGVGTGAQARMLRSACASSAPAGMTRAHWPLAAVSLGLAAVGTRAALGVGARGPPPQRDPRERAIWPRSPAAGPAALSCGCRHCRLCTFSACSPGGVEPRRRPFSHNRTAAPSGVGGRGRRRPDARVSRGWRRHEERQSPSRQGASVKTRSTGAWPESRKAGRPGHFPRGPGTPRTRVEPRVQRRLGPSPASPGRGDRNPLPRATHDAASTDPSLKPQLIQVAG